MKIAKNVEVFLELECWFRPKSFLNVNKTNL